MGFPDMRIWRAVEERCLWEEARSRERVDRRQVSMLTSVNDKVGEKPTRRKSKVSWARVILPGLVGS